MKELDDIRRERAESLKASNMETWILKTPYGPMVHAKTGETYQAYGARLEHEHLTLRSAGTNNGKRFN